MKKIMLIIPLVAISLLSSCGSKSDIVVTFDAGENIIEKSELKKEILHFGKNVTWLDLFNSFDYRGVLKDDYDFLFWSLDGKNPISDDYVINHSITLRPVFAPVNHDYLTFTPRGGQCVFYAKNLAVDNPILEYSFNEDFSNSHSFFNGDNKPISIKVNIGQRLFIRGSMPNFKSSGSSSSDNSAAIINYSEALYSVSGNLNSPLENQTDLEEYAFLNAFMKEKIITAHNLLVGVPKLGPHSYNDMFYECKNLLYPCQLPNTMLADYCYANMFKSSGILVAPELPATTLVDGCYNATFYECKSLKEAPALIATSHDDKKNCYTGMFGQCISLTKAPLIAIENCPLYGDRIFNLFFRSMFQNCRSLNYIKVKFNFEMPYRVMPFIEWVINVAEHGTFVCPETCAKASEYTDFSESTIPVGWTIDNDMSH